MAVPEPIDSQLSHDSGDMFVGLTASWKAAVELDVAPPGSVQGWSPWSAATLCVQPGIPADWGAALKKSQGTIDEPRPSAISSRKYGHARLLAPASKVTQPWYGAAMAAAGHAPVSFTWIALNTPCGVLFSVAWMPPSQLPFPVDSSA